MYYLKIVYIAASITPYLRGKLCLAHFRPCFKQLIYPSNEKKLRLSQLGHSPFLQFMYLFIKEANDIVFNVYN